MTGPFSPEAKNRRRLARLQKLADAFATSHALPGSASDGPIDRQNVPVEAIRLVSEFIGQFTWPMPPVLTYRGMRTATRDEKTPAVDADAQVILSAQVVTMTGCRKEIEIPVHVRAGKLLEPSVVLVDGVPRILAQSLVDEIVRQGTFRQKVDPRGGMFGGPMGPEEYAAYAELDDQYKTQDRYSRGMYAVGSRTAQRWCEECDGEGEHEPWCSLNTEPAYEAPPEPPSERVDICASCGSEWQPVDCPEHGDKRCSVCNGHNHYMTSKTHVGKAGRTECLAPDCDCGWFREASIKQAQKYDPGARVKVSGDAARVIEQVHEPTGNGAWDGTYRVEFQNGRTDVVPESKLSIDEDRQTLRHREGQVERQVVHSLCTNDGACDWMGPAGVEQCPECGSPTEQHEGAAQPEDTTPWDEGRFGQVKALQAARCGAEADRDKLIECPYCHGDGKHHPEVFTVEDLQELGTPSQCPACDGSGQLSKSEYEEFERRLGPVKSAAREDYAAGMPAEHHQDRKENDFSAGDAVSFARSFRNRTRGGPSYLIDSGTGATVVKDVAEDGTKFEVRLDNGEKVVVPRETLKRARRADVVEYPGDPGRYRCARCGAEVDRDRLIAADVGDGTDLACPRCYGLDLDKISRQAAARVDQVLREVESLKEQGYADVDVLLRIHGTYPTIADAVMEAAADKGLLDLED